MPRVMRATGTEAAALLACQHRNNVSSDQQELVMPGHDEATEQRGVSMSYREVSEVRDGMRIDWDMPIEMDDGLVVRADIFRPVKKGRYPVLLSYGPYGKWLHFEDGYKTAWKRMEEKHPDVMAGTTNRYASW